MYLLMLIAFACVLLYLFTKWVKIKNYWASKNVPHQSHNPVLGSLTFLQRVNPGTWMRQMNEHFKSPYFGVWWFWKPVLVVNTPEIARNILVKDFNSFRNRFLSSGANDPIGALNLFTVNDPIWSEMRRKIIKAFSSTKLKQMQTCMISNTQNLVKRIENEIDTEINIREVLCDFTTDVITTFEFGIKSNAILSKEAPFRWVAQKFMEFNIQRGIAWSSIFFCPQLVNTLGSTLFPKAATDHFRNVFNNIIEFRNKNNDSNVNNIMDILLKIREECKDESKLYSDDLILAQAVILLFGGFDSTASLMTFILYEVAHNQDIQETLYNALIEAKQMCGTMDLDYDQLSKMPYLTAVIKETLRKYPSMGWLDRVALNDYRIDDKLTINAGTPVYVNAIGMHYNPEYFPKPLKFDPNRFLPENEKDILPYTYMPFGDGPRSCIGQKFAMMTMRYSLSSLLLNYRILPLANYPKPLDIKIERKGLFYSPGEVLSVKFVPRN